MNRRFTSWSVKTSKLLSAVLRHNSSVTLGKYPEASIEDLHTQTKLRCFDWEPKKFFAFLAANSKNRFSIWISPAALTFPRFYDWDFVIGIGAIQGHTRIPEVVSEEALGERLTIERFQQLGFIFHASHNSNYNSIRETGLSLDAVRYSGQSSRKAIHFVYAGGSVSPGAGTVIKYGSFMFYAQLDYVTFLQHGHELYLTSNGVVLSYKNVAPMYLTHHYRPPHEKDPGGLKYEQKQQGAGVGPSQEGGTSSASASASAAGGSPEGEEPARGSNIKTKAMPGKKRKDDAQTSSDASKPTGSSPQGEVPTLDAASLQKLIRENELLEEKKRQASATTSEGSTSYAYGAW